MDVAIISLYPKPSLYKKMTNLFPSDTVYVQTGIDVRKSSLENLVEANIINETGYTTLNEGRKWHWELNTKGGIGLSHANRIALLKNDQKSLLLFEDDCVIKDVKLKKEVEILSRATEFDMAVFGAQIISGTVPKRKVEYMPEGWYYLDGGQFILLHCVFYSKEGRKKVGTFLRDNPLSMQIDGLYSTLDRLKKIKVIVQLEDVTAIQSLHISTIQSDHCLLCNINPRVINIKYIHFSRTLPISLIILSLVVCWLYRASYKNRIS
jgi:hypothetical protein